MLYKCLCLLDGLIFGDSKWSYTETGAFVIVGDFNQLVTKIEPQGFERFLNNSV